MHRRHREARRDNLPCLRASISCMFPRFVSLEHGAEDNDEFAHDGGDHEFVGFASLRETLREGFEDLMVADRSSCRHKQAGTDLTAARKDAPASSLFAAVPVEWSKAGESNGRPSGHGAQLRHECEHGPCRHPTDPRYRLHEPGAAIELLVPGGQRLDLPLDGSQLLIEQVFLQALAHRFRANVLHTRLLGAAQQQANQG